MPKVSVIVPVYNTEKYLDKCLRSLINQTLTDIEIICINDGSTDKSYEILKTWASADKRIKLLNQENSKQGAARNRGLDIAQGEFVTFVDSDDWVELDFCELLYNAAQKYNVNIAASSTTRDYKHKIKNHLKLKEEKVFNDINAIVKALEYNFITHSKLYRFEPIKDLRFEENVLYEDGAYTIKAFDIEKSLVTVPAAGYHYYSNPTSTMKQKLDIKKENDKISTSLQLIRYAKEHNIHLSEKNSLVYKDDHFWWSIKHYYTKKEFYLCGIKVCTKNVKYDDVKNFLVFNTACFGDVLLCNSLCQNIKAAFPNSKVVFITDKNWADVAKYQKDVDEVIVYDKRGIHKGFAGMLKFLREFPYKKPFASFITYKNERNYTIAKLLKSRFVIPPNKKYKDNNVLERHSLLIESLTNKPIINYPIKYNLPNGIINPLQTIIPNEKYIALCCISKNPPKDMPLEMAIDLIETINSKTNYRVVLTGAGEKSIKYAEDLTNAGVNFINLVNKTTLLELGAVLKDSIGLISVDTGTMHYGYSLGVKTLCLFFERGKSYIWGPIDVYNNTTVLDKNFDVREIINTFANLRSINE